MASLCVRCESFHIHSFEGISTSPWRGYRVEDVQESAEKGCPFCRQLADSFPATFGPGKARRIGGRSAGNWVHLGAVKADDLALVLGTRNDAATTPGLRISFLKATVASNPRRLVGDVKAPENAGIAVQFRAVADPDDPAAVSSDIVGRYIYTGTKSTSTPLLVPSIKAWLAACYRHDRCSRTLSGRHVDQQNPPLPTRCVHVWTDQGTAKFRLQNTTGSQGAYITISHRWLPNKDMNSTTPSNLQSRLGGESFGPLPPLFMDAITIAASLAISYVWIDALCIVQGSGGEWGVEAEKMADYYQNSLFTIACTSATQTTGLFNNTIETDTTQAPPLIRLPYRNSAGEKQGDFYLCPDQGEEEKDYWENVASSELLSRGWVFQEWALSRRIVCCTSSDVFFRCKESPLRTASGVIQPRKQWDHMPDFKLRDMFSTFHLLSKSELSLAWMTIVEAYSVLQLTRPAQDRLVALSGVADEFGRALAQQEEETETATEGGRSIYVAGLWLSVVLDGLLWEKVSEEPHRQLNHIPSYSWASVYSRVRWSSSIHLDQSSGDCELIEVLYPQPENVSSIDDRSFVSGPPEYRPPRDLADSPRSSRFPVLCLRTKLQPVLLGDQFRNRDDRDLAARLTQQVPSAGEKGWRRVASHLDREHVAGWASLEHPEFQLDSNSPGGSSHVIFALHIARRFARSAPGLGYKMGIHSIFNVLFVRRVETVVDGFERIGVGALFGKDIERQFETAVQREIRLL